jgi:hypothetical protein
MASDLLLVPDKMILNKVTCSPLEVVEADNLCLDEAPLKVGVDHTSSLGRQRAFEDGPAAHLKIRYKGSRVTLDNS